MPFSQLKKIKFIIMVINKLVLYVLFIFFANYSSLFQSSTKLKINVESIICNKKLNNLLTSLPGYFGSRLLVHLLMNDNPPCLSPTILNKMSTEWQLLLTVTNSATTIEDSLVANPDVYIMIISNFYTLTQVYDAITVLMNCTKAWNPGAKFLLITTSQNYSKQRRYQLVTNGINYLWRRNIFKLAIVMFEDNNEELILFSSSPYSNLFQTCKEINDPAQLEEVNLSVTQLKEVNVAGFQYKTPKSFSGCPLIAFTFPLPPYSVVDMSHSDTTLNPKYKTGLEIELVFLLANLFNFSLCLNTAVCYLNQNGWYYVLPNGTTIGMFQDLVDFKIDLAFAGSIPSYSSYYEIDHCYTLLANSVSWYVSGGEILPSWILVTNIFTIDSWFLLSTAYISFSQLYHAVSVRTTTISLPEPPSLTMWRVLLSVALHWSPEPLHLRLLLFSWSLFSLHVTIMFTTKLLSLLAEHPMDPGIRSLQELNKSDVKACMSQIFREFYLNKTDGYTKKILERAIICNNIEEVIQQFLDDRNFAILSKDDYLTYLIQLEKLNIHKLEQKFFIYPVTMMLTKGSFLKKPLDVLISKVFTGGLFQKWSRDILLASNATYIPNPRRQKQKYVIHLDDFVWLFIILLIGHSLSFLIFLKEMFYSRFGKNM